MTPPEKILLSIRAALGQLSDVREKKMFGKIAFMVNDKLCIAAGKEDIMCRIDPLLQEEIVRTTHAEPVIMRNRIMKGYMRIKLRDLQAPGAIEYWIDLCLDYNKKMV